MSEPSALLQELNTGPWGKAWALGGDAVLDATVALLSSNMATQARNWRAPLDSVATIELTSQKANDRLRISCHDDGAKLWDVLGSFGTMADDAIVLGGWTARREPHGILIEHNEDPGKAALSPSPHAGLAFALDLSRVDVPLLIRRPRQLLQVAIRPDERGTVEVINLGLPGMPVRELPADALHHLPVKTLCAFAFNIDGPALARHISAIPTGPRAKALALFLHSLLALRYEPISWEAFHGTWQIAVVQAMPMPALYIRLPLAADALITDMLRRDGLDPTQAVDAPLPLPPRWNKEPFSFSIRRLNGQWCIASDMQLLSEVGTEAASPIIWPEGTVAAGVCNGPELARTISGFTAFTIAAKPQLAPLLRNLGMWLQRAAPLIPSSSLAVRYDGTTFMGDGINSLPILLSGMVAILVGSEAVEKQGLDSRRNLFTALTDKLTTPASIPESCPCGAGKQHWWYFPPSASALPEQPVLILDPACLADGLSRGRRLNGHVFVLPPKRQAVFQKVAERLRANPPTNGASGADWADVIALYGGGLNATPDRPEYQIRSEANFRIADPGQGWFAFDATATNPQLTLAYRCIVPSRFMGVIVEANPGGTLTDPNSIHDVLGAMATAQFPGTERIHTGELQIAGRTVPWRRYRMPQRVGEALIRDDVVLLNADTVYEIIFTCYANDSHADQARDHALAAFAYLDASRVRLPLAPEPVRTLTSTQLPYRLDLPGEGWTRWDSGAHDSGWAELGAHHKDAWLVAGGWRIGSSATTPEALAAALFPFVEAAWPNGGFSDIKPISGPGWIGMQATLRRQVETISYVYKIRAVRRGTDIFLLLAYRFADHKGGPSFLDDAVAALVPDAERPNPTSGPDLDKIYNRLGWHASEAGRWEDACAWFKAGFAVAPRDHTLASNVVMALHRLKRSTEALDFLSGPAVACLEHQSVAAWRAYLLSEIGKDSESVDRWRDIFAAGWTDTNDLRLYVELLERMHRRDDALAVFAAYPAAGKTREGRLLEAKVLQRANLLEKAIQILREVIAEKSDVKTQVQLAVALRLAGDLESAIAACNQAATLASGPDASVEYERGLCLVARDDIRGAREAFSKVVVAEPENNDARAQLRRLDGLLSNAGGVTLLWGDAIAP
ncbi:MAG: hypothetical protein AAB263_13955, partial [Planctomycetota bacterium]